MALERTEVEIPLIERAPELADFQGMAPVTDLANSMSAVSGFIQREPVDGASATQKTTVYLGYDQKNLYALFLAFDTEAEKIRAHMSPRERVFGDDYVDIQIDTFNDQRRAYTFLATSLGIQWDALWTEGQDFDETYQAVWYSNTEITDKGYMVLFTIPFTSIRFPPNQEQTWGIMLNRTIPRLSEESFWPGYSNKIVGRLNQAAIMKGIRGISPGRNIQINPFGFVRNFKTLDPDTAMFVEDDFEPDAGVDAKLVIKDGLVLDMTVNPDFSQVESDEPQITVNQRFEVFFPERRPFFLENADFFRTPIDLVFTRRIVDPRGGVKLTGKKGAYGIGAMLIDDEAPGEDRVPNDPLAGKKAGIGIFRLSRDISEQSTIGILFTDRELDDQYNRVAAIDGRFKLNRNWVARFQAAASETKEDGKRTGTSYDVAVDRSGRHLNIHNHFLRTSRDFRTRLGFLRGEQRPDSYNLHNRTEYRFRPGNKRLTGWGAAMRIGRIWDTSSQALDTFYDPVLFWNWVGDTSLDFGYAYNRQRLTSSDFAVLSRDKELAEENIYVELESKYFDFLWFNLEVGLGKIINFSPAAGREQELVDGILVEGGMTIRPISPLRIDNEYLFLRLDEPDVGDRIFSNEILRSRWNWQFTKAWSLRAIAQYEDTDPNPLWTNLERERNLNTDLLLRYVINPWTALYLGYNNNRSNYEIVETGTGRNLIRTQRDLRNDGRQLFLKFSYLFQF